MILIINHIAKNRYANFSYHQKARHARLKPPRLREQSGHNSVRIRVRKLGDREPRRGFSRIFSLHQSFHPFQSFAQRYIRKGSPLGVKPRIPDINVKFAFRLCHHSLSLSPFLSSTRVSLSSPRAVSALVALDVPPISSLTPFLSLPTPEYFLHLLHLLASSKILASPSSPVHAYILLPSRCKVQPTLQPIFLLPSFLLLFPVYPPPPSFVPFLVLLEPRGSRRRNNKQSEEERERGKGRTT